MCGSALIHIPLPYCKKNSKRLYLRFLLPRLRLRLGVTDLDDQRFNGVERLIVDNLIHPKYAPKSTNYNVGIAVAGKTSAKIRSTISGTE